MISGVGCDLVLIERIKKLKDKYNEHFVARILSEKESKVFYTLSNENKKISYLAKRFAGKEAIAKALGKGIGALHFKMISILNDELGKPIVEINNNYILPHYEFNISLSDEASHALAFVVISSKTNI